MIKSNVERIVATMQTHDFDDASRLAYQFALIKFKIDENGQAEDKKFPRSSSSLHVEFDKYEHIGGMGGQMINYYFNAWMECEEDE